MGIEDMIQCVVLVHALVLYCTGGISRSNNNIELTNRAIQRLISFGKCGSTSRTTCIELEFCSLCGQRIVEVVEGVVVVDVEAEAFVIINAMTVIRSKILRPFGPECKFLEGTERAICHLLNEVLIN